MGGAGLMLQVLPLALGAAMSPTLVIIQAMLLTGSDHPLRRSWAFAIGRVVSMAVITLGGASLLALLPDFNTGALVASPYAAAIFAAGGVVLLFESWRHYRRGPDPEHKGLAYRMVDLPTAVLALVSAAWVFVNASTLAMYLPALHVITRSDASEVIKALTLTMLLLITTAAAWVPPLLVTVRGQTMAPRLASVQHWLERHGHAISIVVTSVFGVLLLALGIWNGIKAI